MINNNTKQKTNTNTSSISESSIYLKKSELPKDISSFRNDVGYISASALSTWLKEHSYISKSEITALIQKANLVVVDSINKSMDDDAIARLNADVSDIKGEIVAIKDRLVNVEEGSITIDIVETLAKKSDIPTKVSDLENDKGYLTKHQSLAAYAKKEDIPDVSGFITVDELPEGLATKEWVEGKGYLTNHQSLSGYAKKSDLPDTSNFVTRDDIPDISGLASKTWVEGKGYLTRHQSLSGYAKKSDLPDTSAFATQEWVQEQGYLSDTQDLSEYAKKSDLTGFLTSSDLSPYAKKNSVYNKSYIDTFMLSKEEAGNTYPSKVDVDNIYLSKTDARKQYLMIEDYNGIKDASVISTAYNEKTMEDLEADVNKLRNGFYIVHYNDIAIVENHQVIRFFEDGLPQPRIEWIEEE